MDKTQLNWLVLLVFLTTLLLISRPEGIAKEVNNDVIAVENPILLTKSQIDFEVYRKGEKIGFHNVQFQLVDNELIVNSTFEIKIDFLFFTAFHFNYQCESRWENGILKYLKAKIDDDGEISFVKMSKTKDIIHIKNSAETYTVKAPLFPTNHWNADVLEESRVLNTLTGRINEVKIKLMGTDTVITENGEIKANYFRYTGDLDTEIWYDYKNRWVKLRFKGKDDSIIEYRCTRCQVPSVMHKN